jgi:fucose permease
VETTHRTERTKAFRRSRAAVRTTFAAHAVVAGTVGPWVPRLRSKAGLDSGELGIALAGFAVGLVAGTRLAGPIARRVGVRATLRIGVPTLAVGLAVLPLATDLIALTAAFVGVGVVSGVLDVGMNLETVAVEDRFDRRVMSSMHAMWSISMLVAALVASLAIGAGASIEPTFLAVSALMIVVSFPVLNWLPPAHRRRAEEADEAPQRPANIGRVASLCLIGFAMFMTEGIAADWSAVYLRDVHGASAGVAGFGVVAFSAGMAASRLVGDGVRRWFEPSALVRAVTIAGAVALVAASVLGTPVETIASLTVLGLSLGPVVPYAFGAAGRVRAGRGRPALPAVVTASYVGSIVGPLAVGFTASLVGLDRAFMIPVVLCLATAVVSSAVRDETFEKSDKRARSV